MDPFIGEIRLLPYNFAPRDWAACNGAQLPIQSNVALFSLIGTAFGGDGQTNFNLPDLRDKSPFPQNTQGGYYIALNGVFPERD
jgi:microcystin-dependent protein